MLTVQIMFKLGVSSKKHLQAGNFKQIQHNHK